MRIMLPDPPSWCVTSLFYNRCTIASQPSSVIPLLQFMLCVSQMQRHETGWQKQLLMTVYHGGRSKNAVMARNQINLPMMLDEYFKTNNITKKTHHFHWSLYVDTNTTFFGLSLYIMASLYIKSPECVVLIESSVGYSRFFVFPYAF